MHASIYNNLPKINAVVHTHSPFKLVIAISLNRIEQIIEEAKVVVGDPVIIPNKPSGSIELVESVSSTFERRDNDEG
jgi:ribulose-5-phosphate 4-epimerase/fuculose-1-phosphate aldolase